jgi:trimethylamine:corrinoid methyltransferase-like protein
MRPTLKLLDDRLAHKIVAEARMLLCTLGVTIHNESVLSMLGDHGAKVDLDKRHVTLTDLVIDQALESVPSSFRLYDVLGEQTHDFSDDNSHFTPGSAAINILDNTTGKIRKPTTADYVRYANWSRVCRTSRPRARPSFPPTFPRTFPTAIVSFSVCCTARNRLSPERSPRTRSN